MQVRCEKNLIRGAAFNTGPEFHALDHIAPIAKILHIPLITDVEKNYALSSRFYPQIQVEFMPDLERQLGALAERFDTLFECKYWPIHLKPLFRQLYKKEMRLVFCPHGQSDKGYGAPLLAPYAWQDVVLLYGDLLQEMLKELGIWPSISSYAVVGNYRLWFYQKHQLFYDRCFEKEIPLNKKKRTLLYAPTWRDADAASSFFQYGKKVIAELPSDWNLLFKPHPLIEQRDPAHFYSIRAALDQKPNAFLMSEFPALYPILAQSDIYLGDASSVGYDFLFFQRPLYFFPTDRPGKLHACGQVIDPEKNIYRQLDVFSSSQSKQRDLYQFAFGSSFCKNEMRKAIYKTLLKDCYTPSNSKTSFVVEA